MLRGDPDDLAGTHRFAHKAMATVFEIVCAHEDREYAGQAAQAAFDLIDRVETDLTCHRSSSDISRINRLKPGETTPVGLWTMDCLLIARHFYRATGGAFDISMGSGLEHVGLIPAESAVRIHAGGVQLDLGGIGKGYAVDRAGELLEEWEVRQALVHGGFSSVLALDAPPDRGGWPLTISLPTADPACVLARVEARRQSWSASGIRKKDHIVDPRTGVPVRNRSAVWVSGRLESLASVYRREEEEGAAAAMFETGASPSAVAEALSTAFMILSFEEIAALCLKHPGIEARVVIPDPSKPSAQYLLVSFGQ